MQSSTHTQVTIVSTLNLGEHTLALMSDQSISITDSSGNQGTPAQVTRLNAEETYRLLVTLQTLFR